MASIKDIGVKIWKRLSPSFRLKLIRSIMPKFTVSVVAVIFNDENKVLLLDHVVRPKTSWGLPGGFIDANEMPVDAIRREIREEADLELSNVTLDRVKTIGKHVEIVFFADANGEPKVNSLEIKNLGWFTVDEIAKKASKSQSNLVNEILERRI